MMTSAEPSVGLQGAEREAASRRRADIAARHLGARGTRPASSARGVHHVALLSSDVERTVDFYQGLLEFPLTEMFENRDYGGSAHLLFFHRPGHDPPLFPPSRVHPPPPPPRRRRPPLPSPPP